MVVPDGELVKRTIEGDKQAYEILVERYSRGIFGFIRNNIAPLDEVEDLSQEVFLKAYSYLASLRNPEQFSYWLFRIAKNACIDFKRKKNLNTQPLLEEVNISVSSPEPAPKDPWTYVYTLPEKYRAILILKYGSEEMTCQEIAENLNISLNATTKRLSRAYQMMREEAEKHKDSES